MRLGLGGRLDDDERVPLPCRRLRRARAYGCACRGLVAAAGSSVRCLAAAGFVTAFFRGLAPRLRSWFSVVAMAPKLTTPVSNGAY